MPDPLIIIAPGRSYTSLIGGMLGQHPEIYGMPEVNMFHADTLGEVLQSFKGPLEFALAGILRLLAELHDGEQTEETVQKARQWLMQHSHWSTAQVFEHIQDLVGDKILLDKSPMTVLRPAHLERLHRIFPNANYLHLTRHPITTGKSAASLRDSLKKGDENRQPMQTRGRRDPETTWQSSHANILAFTDTLPVGQCMRIKAEWLLREPDFYLGQICDWLGISKGKAAMKEMMHPEKSPFATIGPPSALYGNDPNFLKNPVIDFDRLKNIKEPPLDAPVDWRDDKAPLSAPTLKMARQFGYG